MTAVRFSREDKESLHYYLMRNRFFSLDSEYLPAEPVVDDLFYHLIYRSETETKEILASDICRIECGAAGWPEELHKIKAYLDNIVAGLGMPEEES